MKKIISIFLLLSILNGSFAQTTSWTGTTSVNWSTASNWTNGIPDAATDVIIGDTHFTGSFQPKLSTTSYFNNLSIGGVVASTLTVPYALTGSGAINISANGTISHTTTAVITVKTNWTNLGTYTGTVSSALVKFAGNGNINGNVTAFQNITVNAGCTVNLNTNISVATLLSLNGTIIPTEQTIPYVVSGSGALTVGSSGILKVNASRYDDNYTLSGAVTLAAGSTVEYSATAVNQQIKETFTYSTLRISGSGSVKTPAGNLPDLNSASSKGNVYVTSGTLDLSVFTMNRGNTVVSGTFSVSNDAVLKIGGTNGFPANYNTVTLGATSTVEYNGANQNIGAKTYGNLILSSSGGSAIKSMPATAFTVQGNFTMSKGNGTAVSFTEAAAVTFKGEVNIGASTTLNTSTFSGSVTGNITNNGTLNGGTGTITMNGTGSSLKGSGAYNFYNLTISALNNTVDALTNIIVAGNLTTSGPGTFSPAAGETITMTGTAKKIVGTGHSFSNLSVSGTVTTANNFTISGDLSVTGSFSGTGTVTLSGSSKTLSGTGSISFQGLAVTGSITSTANFTISSSLNIGGSFTATSGTTTFMGTSLVTGTPNLYNVVSSGFSTVLSANAVLGIANTYTLTAGTLNVTSNTPNTVKYNGSGSQNITGGIYNNLSFSNGNVKTATGILTVNGNITIATSTTLAAGTFAHKVYGNWVNNGIFTGGSGTINFTGSSNNVVSGNTTFSNLTINKSSSAGFIILSNDITVNNTLSFILGKIQTGSNTAIIASAGNISGAAQNTGWVNGKLRKNVSAGTGISRAFEIGDASRYTPVTTDFTTAVTSPGTLTASTTAGDHPNIITSGVDPTKSVNRFWTLVNSGISPVGYSATFNFNSGDLDAGTNTAALLVKNHNSSWHSTTPGTRTSTSTQAADINSFGDFQLGEFQVCVPPVINTPVVTNVSCNANSDGSIVISTTGGTVPFEYLWSNGATTQNLNGLAPGDYSLVITAMGGCTASSGTLTVTEPAVVDAAVSGGNQTVCSDGDNTQTITAIATGGTISWYDAPSAGNLVSPAVQTGIGTVTYYAQNNVAGCRSATRTAVTLTINQSPLAPVSGGDQNICSNADNTQTLTATATSNDPFVWYDAPTGGNIISSPVQTGAGTVIYYAEASNGTCNSPSRTPVTLSINPLLPTPGTITGPLDVCPFIDNITPVNYSISPVPGATSYSWAVPRGTTIVSGQGTTMIGVKFDNSFALTNSKFTVMAESETACTSGVSTLEVLKVLPGIATAINGPLNVCDAIGQPVTVNYFIDVVPNATSYTWAVPPGANIVSGQGSTSVQISFDSSFVVGSIKVTANSNCGSRAPRSLSVSRLVPVTPTAIDGPVLACPFIGTGTPITYTIQPTANSNSYTWTVPSNVTLVSGQGTTSITVTFNSGYRTSSIKVRGMSNCSHSGDRSLTVVSSTYRTPGAITGPRNVCPFMGGDNDATYSIRSVANAASYIWTMPAGAVITSHPAGLGANDTIITVSFNNDFVTGTTISVQADGCVPSTPRTFTVTRVLPSKPLAITGPTNVCPYVTGSANSEGPPVTYSTHRVADAAYYEWTVPAGARIAAHPAGSGINDTVVQVAYTSDFISGTISVTSGNGCGVSGLRTLSISKLRPSTPGGISAAQTSDCPNRRYTYSLAVMPANATSVLWTVPAGATILSGQGSTSIDVTYSTSEVNSTVTATGFNTCSNGSTRTLTVRLSACAPGFAGRSKAAVNDDVIKPASTEGMKINVFPNPAVSEFKLQVLTGEKEDINVKLMNLDGKELSNRTATPYKIINFGSELKAGVYIVEVTQGRSRVVQKLIKL